MSTLIIFLVLLSVLVIAHEFGHFFAARRAGMKVEEFGLGFPPRLWSWKDKKGTRWSLNLFPLGGFVKIKGENGEEKEKDETNFTAKSIPWRLFVLSGGIIMNVIAAWALFSFGFATGIPALVDSASTDPNAIISGMQVRIIEVQKDSPAAKAGLVPGDTLLRVNGQDVTSATAVRDLLAQNTSGAAVDLVLAEKTLTVTPTYSAELSKYIIGAAFVDTGMMRYPWYTAPLKGLEATIQATKDVVVGLWTVLTGLIGSGKVAAELSGPVGIAVLTGQVAKMGFAYLLQFAAMLSINLAILNALPIPALDGGRILFVLIEAIRRKPLSGRTEQTIHAIGFALLIILVLCVTYRDVLGLLR
jgi:regulator of sigma E protease